MKALLVALLLPLNAMADSVGVFYDHARRLAIAEFNWFHAKDSFRFYGFTEAYRLPAEGFPAESNVIFGKAWLTKEVAPKVHVGLEIEYGRNNAGMWTQGKPFQPNQWRAIPKIGVSVELW